MRLLLAIMMVLAASSAHASASSSNADSGKRIYREGLLPSGQPLRGTMQNGVVLNGEDAACVKCHRRSGLGSGEGQITVRPIAGRLLFEPPLLPETARPVAIFGDAARRPAYSRETLARTLREGVDPAGRTLDALMPRYRLSDAEVASLADHLEELGAASSPGVTASEIHFATIVAPGVSAAQERAMLDVLQAFFGDKNADPRLEKRRKEFGGEQMYSYYRAWRLHVWRLDGPPETWNAQLDEQYRRQPVFALLSGVGEFVWHPVHEFCEKNEVPCLFPNINVSEIPGTGYASFYFSRGAVLEAEVVAKHLGEAKRGDPIVQVFRDDERGQTLARTLRTAMLQRNIGPAIDRPLAAGEPVPGAFWRRLLDEDRPATLILWLPETDIGDLITNEEIPPSLDNVYLSATMGVQPGAVERASDWLGKIRLAYPFELPALRARRLVRMQVWLRARNVPLLDERIQANAFFAATLAGEALAHMNGNFSRDYFIERVEQMTEQSPVPSIYPRLSLGPGQRFASKGQYVARFTRDERNVLAPSGVWIVP